MPEAPRWGDASSMDAQFRRPDPRLEGLISGYHAYRDPAPAISGQPSENWFFPAWANIRFVGNNTGWRVGIGDDSFAVPGAALFGPTSRAQHSYSWGGMMVGAGITPLGWSRLFDRPAVDFADRIVPLRQLWPEADVDALRLDLLDGPDIDHVASVLDRALVARLRPPHPSDALVAQLHALLLHQRGIEVQDVVEQLDLSDARLRRIAARNFGFGPKLLLRRARFLKSLVAIHDIDQGEWGRRIDRNYYDQSHFIRDSREFLGMSPREFFRRLKPMTLLSMRNRAEQLGTPMQALYEPPQSKVAGKKLP